MNGSTRVIRSVIVDDEEPARNELRYLLEQYDDVRIIGEAATCQEALEAVRTLQPHVLFMDIQLPGMTGIQTTEKILEAQFTPLVVFATAHEEYAFKAFELNAVDYLLKPFAAKRIEQCLNKVRILLNKSIPIENIENVLGIFQQPQPKQRLAIEHGGKATIINTDDILAASCSDGQLTVYTREKTYHCTMTLQELQSRLSSRSFFRSHRAFLVNLEKIREIIPWFNGTYNLVIEGLPSLQVPVSRQHAAQLKKFFNL